MNLHVLENFHFCPVCGSGHFEINDSKSKRCADCGFTYYLNSAAAVVGIVLNNKKEVLVSRRALAPAQGTLDFPGGFVDPGESVEQAIFREMKEETGMEVTMEKWLFSIPNKYRYGGMDIFTTDNFIFCNMEHAEEARAHDDAAELLWIPPQSLRAEEFGLQSMRTAVPLLQHKYL